MHLISRKLARPWPRACRIINNVLLTLILFMFFDLFFGTFAMKANSNRISEHCVGQNNKNEFEQQFGLELLFLV